MKKSIITLSLLLSTLCSSAQIMPLMDIASEDCGVGKVHSGTGLPQAFTGKGVVVGIVDAGIDYTHPAFRNADGSLRIAKVWEQGTENSAFGHIPSTGYGTEFTTSAEILKAAADTEAGSHGTHVLGIAAGSTAALGGIKPSFPKGVTAIPEGVAPEAELVVVAIPQSGDLGAENERVMDAIRYIYAYADEVGKPCVINLSLGSHMGPHDGTSTFDVFADNIQGPGRLIVGAAGNFGSYKSHLHSAFDSANDAPAMTFVDFYSPTDYKYKSSDGEIDVWGDGDFEISMVAYKTNDHIVKNSTVIYPVVDGNYKTSNITGEIIVTSEVSPLNGKHHVHLKSAVTGTRTNYALALQITPKGKASVDMWSNCNRFEFGSHGEEGFTEPVSESTVVEIGGTAKRIISVGAYVTRSSCTLDNGRTVEYAEKEGDLFSFSGFGPTVDGRMKPEVCAPGGIIVSSFSSQDASASQQLAFTFDYEGTTHKYGYLYGTSMSSPFVAGTMALWLQACPTLTPEQAVEVIRNTSSKVDPTAVSDATHWGYGCIDVHKGIQSVCEISGITAPMLSQSGASVIYDLTGRRVINPSSHGIYIVDGRKIRR